MIWCLCGRKHAYKPLQRIFTDGVELYGKNLENEPEVPCSQSGEVFFQKATGQILRGVICLCTHGGERSRQAPDELDILTSVPCVWGR